MMMLDTAERTYFLMLAILSVSRAKFGHQIKRSVNYSPIRNKGDFLLIVTRKKLEQLFESLWFLMYNSRSLKLAESIL